MHLDGEGVCRACRFAVQKAHEIDWKQRAETFRSVVARARAKKRPYDCVIPVSGGKDSFWQVVTCLAHGLHPLCVTYAVPGRNDLGRENLRRLVDIGVDHFDFRPNPDVERRFIDKAFRTTGISGLVTHMAIFAVPVRTAVAFDIPLVVYGENSAFEYGTDDDALAGARLDHRWLQKYGSTGGTTASDWVDDTLTEQALGAYRFPAAEELAAKDIEVCFLGHYVRWDPAESRRVAERHGFRARAEGPLVGHYDYANIDDDFLGIHQHTKWHKFGITRSWDTLSMEIRNDRLTRDEAIDRLRQAGDETPRRDIELFCRYLGISVREYFRIVEQFRNRDLWTRRDGRWVIDDFLIRDFPWPQDELG